MMLALVLALLSGALGAALVCKAIHLKLWLDLAAGAGCLAALAGASWLAGAKDWPIFGWPIGFLAVVVYLRLRKVAP